jgi:hypothetical protein
LLLPLLPLLLLLLLLLVVKVVVRPDQEALFRAPSRKRSGLSY